MGLFKNTLQPSSTATEDDTATSNFNTGTSLFTHGKQRHPTNPAKAHERTHQHPDISGQNVAQDKAIADQVSTSFSEADGDPRDRDYIAG
ncbi:hypothetical protein Nepgr_014810 [Nepenthes gracilis]|uniref:Uncharacterized protein n=1 Tax=Nepenthes gracilis TaxID=150966 RepID=A0AAD3SLJ0_NEPGR|nr:hypothetical protein Nepgr_014810 [Nepenthes gracilis]